MALALQVPVTSVALTAPNIFSVSGSPLTAAGTLGLTLVSQNQNLVWASPNGSSGAPTFRALLANDIPPLAYVTSVGLSLPGIFSVSGSPVTASGTLSASLVAQAAHSIFAGPTSGGNAAPTFRSLVLADIPDLSSVYLPLSGGAITGNLSVTGSFSAASAAISGILSAGSLLMGGGVNLYTNTVSTNYSLV